MGKTEAPCTLLEIKCAGENCLKKVYIKGDEGLTVDGLKFSCNACNVQTKHNKESKKSTSVRKLVEGQLKFFDETEKDE